MTTAPEAQMLQTLIDRQAIEDLFTRYYLGLDAGDPEGFGKFFFADAELDVNGMVTRSHAEIAELYRDVKQDKAPLHGTFRMLLSNLLIEIDGDTAKAQCLWTQLLNDNLMGPPRLIEQGREYDLLEKVDGKWKIRKRVVIADSGLPHMMLPTYTPRADYSTADL